jgi:glucosamine--fructose-6-phosphate aminotransferase (isomerizing)
LPLPFEMIDWKIENTQKGDYPHFMLKEIYEQPPIIANIATTFDDQIMLLVDAITKAKGTFFIGAGTAYHACLGGVYLFSKNAHIHVNTALASEFNYLEDFLTDKSLVIALSQSGETIDVIEPLNRAREKGSKIVGLVNTLGSTIYRMADVKVLIAAGPEKAVASTKAYIAKIAIMFLLSYAMKGELEKAKKLLTLAAEESARLLLPENVEKIEHLADVLQTHEHLYVIGRGVSYSSAMEAALKVKEVSYIHTEGLAGGELKHGTIALISKGTPCIVFAPKDETYEAMISNAMEIKARGGIIIGVGPKNEAVFDHWIEVRGTGEWSVVIQTVPLQLLAYFLALSKNLDPDKPRNLAKSVTVK